MGTLHAVEFGAIAELSEQEASFLGVLVRDLVRDARLQGRARLVFRDFVLSAQSQPLGARLVAVTWTIARGGEPVARDVAIQYR